jgi:hypothetical protein
MKRHGRLLLVACLSCACESEPGKAEAKTKAEPPTKPVPAPPTQPADDGAAEPEAVPSEPGPPAKDDRWRSSLAGAKAAGLPPLAFSFALPGDAGMSGDAFGDGDYVTLSGPPGGTLMLRITPAKVGADPAGLVSRDGLPTTPQEVELLGAKQPAVAWVSGESMARTAWCGIIVAPAGAAEGAPALLLELGVGHYKGEAACAPTLEDDALGTMAKSLVFE